MLLPEFERAGLPVSMLDRKRRCTGVWGACSGCFRGHRVAPWRTRNCSQLSAAPHGVLWATAGNGRASSTVDISPLVAATYSHWLWLSHNETNILDSVW